MKPELLEQLVEAVLYEGHILYPYRPSSPKNQQRFTFGRVYPEPYSAAQGGAEPCSMQTQCILRPNGPNASLGVEIRFLHPITREIGVLDEPLESWTEAGTEPAHRITRSVEVDGKVYHTWQEAAERRIQTACAAAGGARQETAFSFPAARAIEPIRDDAGAVRALIVRRNDAVEGILSLALDSVEPAHIRVSARIVNRTPMPDAELAQPEAVLARTFVSTHTILRASGADFLSVTSPPAEGAAAAASCLNLGTWPVLVGDEAAGERDTILSSPIILPDYPRVAPESAGSLFDATEIDEILTLRILTMTDGEKREMRDIDERARRLLERTETLPVERRFGMHGTWRTPESFDEAIFGGSARIKSVEAGGVLLRAGDVVRIRPKARADVMDLALAGKTAVIEALEQDAEGRVHLALVLEDDPGRDLGLLRQPGHRFFYGLDEIEPCRKERDHG